MDWINVNDKLPEYGGTFIVSDGSCVLMNLFFPDMNRFGISSITHWMPLPEPPQRTKKGYPIDPSNIIQRIPNEKQFFNFWDIFRRLGFSKTDIEKKP